MATQVQLRRGTSTQNDSFTGAQGELTFDTTNKRVRIHDGATTGGFELKTENSSGDTLFADGEKAIFGGGSDLSIYSDGTTGQITGDVNITGTVSSDGLTSNDDANATNTFGRYSSAFAYSLIRPSASSTGIEVRTNAGNALAHFLNDGTTKLHHNGSAKISTTATGIDVTGTVTSDGLTVDANATGGFKVEAHPSGTGTILTSYQGTTNSNVRTLELAGQDFIVSTGLPQGTTTTDRLLISADGDISFYEDTGTTAKFFWDASAESLGIGETNPNTPLHIQASTSGAITIDHKNLGNSTIFPSYTTSASYVNSWLHGSGAGPYPRYIDIVSNGDSSTGGNVRILTNASGSGTATERMRIDSSGNVGIGITPESWSSSYTALQFAGNGALSGWGNQQHGAAIFLSQNSYVDASGWKYISTDEASRYEQVNGAHTWSTAASGTADTAISWSEAMRIDSSGNLLVGKTSASLGTVGARIDNAGGGYFTANGGIPMQLNRLTSDGAIAQFYKDGTTVGSIGSTAGHVTIGHDDVGIRFHSVNNLIYPHNMTTGATPDGTISFGSSGSRFKDLYLSGGVYLGGTGAANKLDDYEVGTWTAQIFDATSGGNASSTVATGYYTKIGRLVTATAVIGNISTSGMTSSNQLCFTLPFTPSSNSRGGGAVHPQIVTLNANCASLTTIVNNGVSRARILQAVSASQDNFLLVSALNSGTSDFSLLQFIYEAA